MLVAVGSGLPRGRSSVWRGARRHGPEGRSRATEMRPGDPIPTISGFRMVTVLFIKVRSARKTNAAQPGRAQPSLGRATLGTKGIPGSE